MSEEPKALPEELLKLLRTFDPKAKPTVDLMLSELRSIMELSPGANVLFGVIEREKKNGANASVLINSSIDGMITMAMSCLNTAADELTREVANSPDRLIEIANFVQTIKAAVRICELLTGTTQTKDAVIRRDSGDVSKTGAGDA